MESVQHIKRMVNRKYIAFNFALRPFAHNTDGSGHLKKKISTAHFIAALRSGVCCRHEPPEGDARAYRPENE